MPWRSVSVTTTSTGPMPSCRGNPIEHLSGGAGVQERGQQHVAGDSTDAVEVEDPGHRAVAAARAIRAAIVPAPNPSSIPTTASPAAHEQSMALSAVSPPRAEP